MNRTIIYRVGGITDLATDIAFELTLEEGEELVHEILRFIVSEPDKFQDAARRMNKTNDQS